MHLNAVAAIPDRLSRVRKPEGSKMLDVIMLAIGVGFLAASVGYTIVCDRL